MTNEEFKKIPFKYDGEGNPVTFGEAGNVLHKNKTQENQKAHREGIFGERGNE